PLAEFGGGTLADALAALAAFAPQWRGKELSTALMHLSYQQGALPAAVICGLEIAWLDAWGKHMGHSAASVLGAYSGYGATQVRTTVPVNAVCGETSTAAVVGQACAALAAGFNCIKLKVGGREPAAEVERVAAVRAALGPLPRLRLDAN